MVQFGFHELTMSVLCIMQNQTEPMDRLKLMRVGSVVGFDRLVRFAKRGEAHWT